jgi:methionyl-tRNA formyltransferase
MLAGKGNSTKYIYNGVSENYEIDKVLLTDTPSKKILVKRRAKKLGYLKVFDQLLFQFFILKFLKIITSKKLVERLDELKLKNTPIPINKIIAVGKVNSSQTIESIKNLNPDVILVNGTAIILSKVLESTEAIFINSHVGITPQYRGVHGGYWALRNNDQENFGVTVHVVDKGIDTGSIIYQETTQVKKEDNFLTYPLYQYALAIPLLKKSLRDIENENFRTFKKDKDKSKLYYHPGVSKYITGVILKGIK